MGGSEYSGFPLPALVGNDELRLALVLCAIDPAVGGVLVRGEKGSGKTTAARGFAGVLPGTAPFVELPLGATEERVVGSLDLRAALTGGEYRFQPGLLAEADGGVLYVDEVNLLADHIVDVLLDVASSGVNRVERDGISHVHASRFVLVGSMNPEEGELRPQLLDRFGLSVTVTAPAEIVGRAEAVRRRLAYDADPESFRSVWDGKEADFRDRLATARPAPLEPGLEEQVAWLCAAAGAEGIRADLVICRAAAALAGWLGRQEAGEAEVRQVAPLALAHRRHTPWDSPESSGSSVDELLDDAFDQHPAPVPPSPPTGEGSAELDPHTASDPTGPPTGGMDEPGGPGAEPAVDAPPLPPPSGPTGLLDQAKARVQAPSGRAARNGAAVHTGARGRVIGSRAPTFDRQIGSVAATATIVAAAGRQAGGGPRTPGSPLRVAARDVREAVYETPTANLVILVVDASGSMGVDRRLEAARTAVLALLVDAYQRRDRVALVTFRGEGAEIALRPTGSVEVASARLRTLATGGRTPLAAGVRAALALASSERHAADRPLVVVVSDGRATSAPGTADPLAAALEAAGAVRQAGVSALMVDCEDEGPGAQLGLGRALADAMGARYLAVREVTGEALTNAVRSMLPAAVAPGGTGPHRGCADDR